MISGYTHSDLNSNNNVEALSAYEKSLAKAVKNVRALERERVKKEKVANDMGPLRILFAINN